MGGAADARATGEGATSAPLISIVVPVYNVERYLEEALESALSQSLADIEVICVDDGSTDGSAKILQRIAERDGRVRVISQANAGVSAARNVALDAARGGVVMFLDGDDLLHEGACERVASVFRETGCDIVTFGAHCFPEGAAPAHLVECLKPRDRVYEGCCDDLLFKENSRPYMWRSAFSRELLEHGRVRFPEGLSVGEDQVFYFLAYPRSRKTVLISDELYEYRVDREGSAMTEAEADDAARVAQHVDAAVLIIREWSAQGWFARFGWQTLGWLMEFVALDLAALPDAERASLAGRIGAELSAVLPRTQDGHVAEEELPFGRATLRVLRWLTGSEDASAPGKTTLYRFYLERRGLAACAKRALRLFGRG